MTHVYRKTIPTGAWGYDAGSSPYTDVDTIDADHHIFLKLDQPIGSRDALSIEGPLALEFTLPFSDEYLETPVIQVNQVGYNPQATGRYAHVSGWLGDGGGLPLAGFPDAANVIVEPGDPLAQRYAAAADLPVTLRSSYDAVAATEVDEIDLSMVPAAEDVRYRVYLPGVGVSWATAISEKAAFKTYYTVMRGLYNNRWAGDLDEQYTEWSRPVDHISRPDGSPSVYTSDVPWLDEGGAPQFVPEDTPLVDPIEIYGGHHDAGDFDIRPAHTAVGLFLMRAYELDPTL